MGADRAVDDAMTARQILLAVVAVLAVTACSDSGTTPDQADDATQTATEGSEAGTSSPSELDCEARNQPCSWSEASEAAVARTDDILRIAAGLLSSGDSVADVAERIGAAEGVVEMGYDEIGILFRVEDGMAVTIDVDPTGTGRLLGVAPPVRLGQRLPSLAQAQGGVFTGCASGGDEADGVAGVARKPDLDRDALVLSPWQFGLPWNLSRITDGLLVPGSMYLSANSGSVISKTNVIESHPFADAPVVPSDFCGWEEYDTILLMTHGRAVCTGGTESDPTGCRTSFSVGRYAEGLEEIRELAGGASGVTVGTSNYGDFLDMTPDQKEVCLESLELLVPPEGIADQCFEQLPETTYTVSVEADFFRANYPNGLPDRVIFLAACQGMKLSHMADALGGGGKGIVLGFDKIATVGMAEDLLAELTERLGKGKRIGDGYLFWARQWIQDYDPQLVDAPLSELPGGDIGTLMDTDTPATWGQDAVRIMSAGQYLSDGATVELADPPPNPEVDALDITLVLTDVDGEEDETPDDFAVELWFDDEQLELDDPPWQQFDGTEYRADVVVDLPRTLEIDEEFDLEIRAVLPAAGNGPTRIEYEDVTANAVTYCDRLTPEAVSEAMGVDVTRVDTGEMGSFFGSLCLWRDVEEKSDVSILVYEGAAPGFRADAADSEFAVPGFDDVATYDPVTGGGDNCGSIRDIMTDEISWICFVNLTVAVGNDTLYFTLTGNVVGENGPDGALAVLRSLVEAIREA